MDLSILNQKLNRFSNIHKTAYIQIYKVLLVLRVHASRLKEVNFFLCTINIYLELSVHTSQSGHLLRLAREY